MKFLRALSQIFVSSNYGIFFLGGLIGLAFFAAFYGLSIAWTTNVDWIWHGVTHDTAQHFLGWEFFRADSSGAVINGLAYPVGLPLTFMDAIPLLALPIKLVAPILPESYQYFGLWALICYILIGGAAAILMQRIWRKVFAKKFVVESVERFKSGKKSSQKDSVVECTSQESTAENEPESLQTTSKSVAENLWQTLFVAAGTLIFVASPIMIARTLYHPALAAQWLILIGILLIWDAAKFAKLWKFIAVWSAMLIGAVLIHPYFLPMLGAMMLVAALRNVTAFSWRTIAKSLIKIIVPVALAGATFAAIGGFALGSGSEIHDLHEKGFNLLSFANPYGYSALIPGFSNASSSPETMMWLGLGVWLMIIAAAILWIGNYKKSWLNFREKFRQNRVRNIFIAIVAVGLLIFAIGIRVDFGPITLFEYSIPDKVYEIWSAFRAAAREAWPFYYALILAAIYWFSLAIRYRCHPGLCAGLRSGIVSQSMNSKNTKGGKKSRLKSKKIFHNKSLAAIALPLLAISLIQFTDIWFSDKATTRREGFAVARTTAPEFIVPEIADLVTTQQHLVALDAGFRGNMTGFYKVGQAALANNLTLNIGFFARVPDEIWTMQNDWRDKVSRGELTDEDLAKNLFFTNDEKIVEQASQNYAIKQRGDFYFITAKGSE